MIEVKNCVKDCSGNPLLAELVEAQKIATESLAEGNAQIKQIKKACLN